MWRIGSLLIAIALAIATFGVPTRVGADEGPAPGTPQYWQRELNNVRFAFGKLREHQSTDGFREAVNAEQRRLAQFWNREDREHFRGRPRLTLTRSGLNLFIGLPWRNEMRWPGEHERIYFLNRWRAKLAGDLWGPADLFESEQRRPTVVITTGSIQGNARMYYWAAQTLAEAGYVVLTYDVQGQGESETFGHTADDRIWCGRVDHPDDTPSFLRETGPCPGVPFQQAPNFGGGAIDAHNFALSTPDSPWEHFADETGTLAYNPWHEFVDADHMGAAGHSLGAAGVSFAQGRPELLREPIKAVVAWDRLSGCSARSRAAQVCPPEDVNEPIAPALNLTNDYFTGLVPISKPPDPDAALAGFDHWRAAGQDVISIALRGGTHLEYATVPLSPLGETVYGNDLARYYTLAFFDRYLRDYPTGADRLLDRGVTFSHLDPFGVLEEPRTWVVDEFTSFYNDSAVFIDGTCVRDWRAGAEPC